MAAAEHGKAVHVRLTVDGEKVAIDVADPTSVSRFAERYRPGKTRFVRGGRKKAREKACIACGQCARVCEEVIGASALVVYKKKDPEHAPGSSMEAPDRCIGCGSCASVCPTRFIGLTDGPKGRTIWGQTFELTRCDRCGAGLLTVKHRDRVLAERPLGADYFTTCSACKRRALAERFSTIGAVPGGGDADV